jgi:hypothetical protein
MNKKLFLILAALLILFFLLATLFLYVFKKNASCVENPLIYGIKGTNLTCWCSDGRNTNFGFNEEGLVKESPLKFYNFTK